MGRTKDLRTHRSQLPAPLNARLSSHFIQQYVPKIYLSYIFKKNWIFTPIFCDTPLLKSTELTTTGFESQHMLCFFLIFQSKKTPKYFFQTSKSTPFQEYNTLIEKWNIRLWKRNGTAEYSKNLAHLQGSFSNKSFLDFHVNYKSFCLKKMRSI